MYELWVSVDEVRGACTAAVPMTVGKGYLVRDGRLHFPGGGPICMYALQSTLPLFVGKERELAADDWLSREDTTQCPDPAGRTVWKIERREMGSTELPPGAMPDPCSGDLLIEVERVESLCTAGMAPGKKALVRGGALYLPQPFCYYALQAVLPLLPAKQRTLDPSDWMATDHHVICPDPAGNAVLRIDKIE